MSISSRLRSSSSCFFSSTDAIETTALSQQHTYTVTAHRAVIGPAAQQFAVIGQEPAALSKGTASSTFIPSLGGFIMIATLHIKTMNKIHQNKAAVIKWSSDLISINPQRAAVRCSTAEDLTSGLEAEVKQRHLLHSIIVIQPRVCLKLFCLERCLLKSYSILIIQCLPNTSYFLIYFTFNVPKTRSLC